MIKILLAALVLSACSTTAPQPPGDDISGALVVGISGQGQCIYKPFIKTGDADDDFMGNHMIIGYSPGDVQITKDGRNYVPERVLENLFIRAGHARSIGGHMCKAPTYR